MNKIAKQHSIQLVEAARNAVEPDESAGLSELRAYCQTQSHAYTRIVALIRDPDSSRYEKEVWFDERWLMEDRHQRVYTRLKAAERHSLTSKCE